MHPRMASAEDWLSWSQEELEATSSNYPFLQFRQINRCECISLRTQKMNKMADETIVSENTVMISYSLHGKQNIKKKYGSAGMNPYIF